ncbi:MAG: TIGR00282 family metallophosphoesterase [Bacillales bacterium]|jgi:metallophosphoesterase (TIGR00282 family)|nr:TIGR00282 family metallophosphoesterase [Bacillales bacterium]
MNILFIGDVYGRPGREILKKHLQEIKDKYLIDFVIANVENSAHGRGVNTDIYFELENAGVDCMTLGNHFVINNEKETIFEQCPRLLRPLNASPLLNGLGTKLFTKNGINIRVSNLLGKLFINELNPDSPFLAIDKVIERNKEAIHIIDFHAEATSEKIALGWYLDGRVSAVLGTHTHIQTSDERILPKGTAYITDAGMTGPFNSVIGVDKDIIIQSFLTGLRERHEVADGPAQLNGVILEVDEITGKSLNIKRIIINPERNLK